MFSFRPSIVRLDSAFELPQPVTSVRVQDSFDFAKLKAPQVAGDFLVGHTSSGVDIAIEGQIGTHSGDLRLTEEQMFFTLESLRQAVHSSSPNDRYRLFLYFDPETKLPVRIEVGYVSVQGEATVKSDWVKSDIVFDAPLDEVLFSTDPPEGYKDLAPPKLPKEELEKSK